jgi:molybdenum cofactor cytidylyltransferase
VAVVLAAGSATRFGATKQLAELDTRPLVTHVVDAALAARADVVVVVVGHDGDRVAAAAAEAGPVMVVANPDHLAGQSTSLRTGIAAAQRAAAEVAVVLLADEPDVSVAAIDAVISAVADGAPAARAGYEDGPAHPVAFARRTFEALLEVAGDRGARDLLADLGVNEVPVAGPRPGDLDTPADLEARRRR